MATNKKYHLRPLPIDEKSLSATRFELNHVQMQVISEAGEWLQAAYQMLLEQFDVDVIDPHNRYVQWLELTKQGGYPFPFLMIAAYIQDGKFARLIGIVEGNIMPIVNFTEDAEKPYPIPLMMDRSYIYAIGHQMTAQVLRNRGHKGIGRVLWNAGFEEATRLIEQNGGAFRYTVLESEDASVGFWSKLGYRWPQGVSYWQPPLEFDSEGRNIHHEVPEILMLKPSDQMPADKIQKDMLLNVVATMFLNWSLHKYRDELPEFAMRRAEQYVMETVFNRVRNGIPDHEWLNLVPFDETLSSSI